MNFDSELSQLQQAWDLAWQTRFCPPDEMILESALTSQAEAHLKACPICRRRKEAAGLEAADHAALAAPSGRTGLQAEDPAPMPGQVRSLNPELACWGPKDRYYNPPVVLVLDASRSLQNGVLVAQCQHDLTFLNEDDVRLGAGRFAEPWNIYTLHRDYLGPVHGVIDQALVQEVMKAGQKGAAELPEWSALYVFRQMELELGSFFSAGAMFALMDEYERLAYRPEDQAPPKAAGPAGLEPSALPPATWLTQTPGDLPDCLRGLGLRVPEASSAAKPADLYFLAEAKDQLDLAAADAQTERLVPVVAFRLRKGRPVSYEILKARLTDLVLSPKVILGGKLTSKLGEGENWQAEFRWKAPDGSLIKSQASHIRWQKSEPAWFWASFDVDASGLNDIEKRFQVRLFSELGIG